jgi:hypothetical protein
MSDEKKDKLAQLLNLSPMRLEADAPKDVIVSGEPETDHEQVLGDFDEARDAILDALKQSQEALASLVGLAKQSQAPRAFEVVSTMVNTIRETSKDLIDIHKKKKDIIAPVEGPKTVNQNLIMTTSDMLKMIREGKPDGQS